MTIIFRSWLFKKWAPNKIDSLKNISRLDCEINPASAKQHKLWKFTKSSGSE